VPDAIEISYSMVADGAYDGLNHCLPGSPELSAEGTLLPGSMGIGAGSDGKDIGRLKNE